jgi:hypothetical protein
MKTLAIIGASYLQRPLVEKAQEMGLRTICFAWAEGAVCKDLCDRFYPVSVTEKEEILRICRDEQIDEYSPASMPEGREDMHRKCALVVHPCTFGVSASDAESVVPCGEVGVGGTPLVVDVVPLFVESVEDKSILYFVGIEEVDGRIFDTPYGLVMAECDAVGCADRCFERGVFVSQDDFGIEELEVGEVQLRHIFGAQYAFGRECAIAIVVAKEYITGFEHECFRLGEASFYGIEEWREMLEGAGDRVELCDIVL